MISPAAQRQDQNDQIVTFTLVEFLTALVFIAMALALILRTEALRDLDPTQEEILKLRREVQARDAQIRALRRETQLLASELEAQRSLVRRLMKKAGAPLPTHDYVVIPKGSYDETRNAALVAQDQQEEIARLQRQIALLRGGGNVTLPKCTTNPGFLLNVRLNANGSIEASPAWPPESASSVARVDGLRELTGSGAMSRQEFTRFAARVDAWGEAQNPPCAFSANVASSHGNLSVYLRQLSTVEQNFYVRRAR